MNNANIQNKVIKLKDKLHQAILDSVDFRDLLMDTVTSITNYAATAQNEASIESNFEIDLYGLLKMFDIPLKLDKEVGVETRWHVGRGRMDSRIGAVVIEYKHPDKLKTEGDQKKASTQLINYLQGLYKNRESFYYGFLTDGIHCKEIAFEDGHITSESTLNTFGVVEALRLIKNMVLLEKTILSPENLIKDFCYPLDNNLIYNMSRTFFEVLDKNPVRKTRMLKMEWEQLFKLGHTDKSQQKMIIQRGKSLENIIGKKLSSGEQYTALFALQTSYAIIKKFIAYRIISELRFEKPLKSYQSILKANEVALRIFCEVLEDGEIFRDLGIINLLEGDFFSWYSDPSQWNSDIAKHIKCILEVLTRYETANEVFKTRQAFDLFKQLYETIMPQSIRSSLGEFYTPSWLTHHVFDSVKPQRNWRGLDPCCGSGTFVLTMVDEVLKDTSHEPKEKQLEEVLRRVHGIDLNPLAVLTARINYFIRISHLIPERPLHLQIPIYLGDACYVPEKFQLDGVECLKYSIKTVEQQIDIIFPRSLVTNTQKFSDLMNSYEKSIKKEDFEGSINILLSYLVEQEKIPSVISELERLTRQLIYLEKEKWNGIWARIISNFLTTAELGEFDIIIGNPPWIDWKNLPSGYRDRIKSYAMDKKLFSGDHRTGGINLNVCALISSVSIGNWLQDNGKLAFLMPKVIVFQQSYDGYRKFLFSKVPRDFIAFYDWSKAGHPFYPITERFMTFVIGPKKYRSDFIPVKNYIKKKDNKIAGEHYLSLETALMRLTEKTQFAGQIMPHNTAFTIADSVSELKSFKTIAGESDYIGREGIEFYPQELLLFKISPNPPVQPKKGNVFVTNIQLAKPIHPVPVDTVEMETKYLYPLVKSAEIDRFKHQYSGIIVPFPYDESNPKSPSDRKELQGTKLLDYFIKYEEIFNKQTDYYQKIKGPNSGEFYGMARVGPYSFVKYYVAFRDSTKWRSVVISPKETAWGGMKRFVFQNHAASICEDIDGKFITEDEAHYICAILNTPIVEKYIEQSSDARSYKIRPPIKIPKFDKENKSHLLLTDLSRKAHAEPDKSNELRNDMQATYLSMSR